MERIDKWLWSVRVYKTRSQAAEACKGGLVKLNGADVKPAREIREGDRIQVRKGMLLLQLEVKGFPKSRVGAKLLLDYLVDHTPPEEIEKLKLIKETAFVKRDKGTGRPTKKERRNLESWGLWD